MKKITLRLCSLLMLLLSINLFSQDFQELRKTGNPSEPTFVYHRPQNCALNTSFLMMDLKQNKEIGYLKSRYSLREIDSELYVGAFLKIDQATFNRANVEVLGVRLNTEAGNFFTALIPTISLEALFLVEGLLKVEIAEKAHSTMDNARVLSNVNQVHSGSGLPQAYTGNNVIVGVIDEGFDYTHPNFWNISTQQTRISRVWEQNGNTTSPASYGTEYIGSNAILNKMRDMVDKSHGTHVAGIAAGSGGITANSTLRGVAYDSEIVLVSTNNTNLGVLDGINYIFDYALQSNRPAVINISLGTHVGPHDGTSDFDHVCNNLVGNGNILVGSAGNEGSENIHLGKSFSPTNEYCYSFILNGEENGLVSNGVSVIDVWGDVGNAFEVSVNIIKIINNQTQLISYTPYYSTNTNTSIQTSIQDSDLTNPDTTFIVISTETNSSNQKPHATLFIDNSAQDDNDHLILFEIKSTNGTVNSWITPFTPSPFMLSSRKVEFTNLDAISPLYVNGDTNITVGEIGGTGNSIISVGAFNSKSCTTMFFNNNNPKCIFDVETQLFRIANFSSKGPTVDGRIKPDITAPGNRIVSSISRFDSRYIFTGGSFNEDALYADVVSGLSDGTNSWRFAANQGTSMSAPMVTGIIALWLQANPNLNVSQIKQIIQNTSITDIHTGTGSAIPNNTWGRGKIDAYAGIQYINQILGVDNFDKKDNFISVYPNPFTESIFIESLEPINHVEIYNLLGQKVKSLDFRNNPELTKVIDLSELSIGHYIARISVENTIRTVKIIKN